MHIAARIVRERFGPERAMVHFVTSGNHAPRVARDAAIAFTEYRNIILSVIPTQTSYGNGDPSQVAIQDLSNR